MYYLTVRNQVDGLLRQVAKTQRLESFDEAVAEEIYLRNRDEFVI